jgi:sulfate adenylyltransferase subunit 2
MSTLDYLQRLEAESIHIFREVVAECEKPVMLARKAFAPAKPPFPLLQIASGWDFREMLEFRDATALKFGLELLVHTNEEGVRAGVKPWTHGAAYSDIMLTQALRQALDKYGFDAAFGGGRRDEEKSRAKERVFSFRSSQHRWDPKNQRPELWSLYNTRKQRGESIRVFPLSNWTELDVWQYIHLQQVPIVPLYLAKPRPVVRRDGRLIMVDDDRLPLEATERVETLEVRFRTLGCYPLTGATLSSADDVPAVIGEMLAATTSEREGRGVDKDGAASMEKRKQEGYF